MRLLLFNLARNMKGLFSTNVVYRKQRKILNHIIKEDPTKGGEQVMTAKSNSTRFLSILSIVILIATLGVANTFLSGCGDDDDDECLVWGENCTQEYLMNTYGKTDIYCCEGQCADHGGYLTCGS